jgi:regulator of protease activity HflC (stomatin/prohibitin superfamily)
MVAIVFISLFALLTLVAIAVTVVAKNKDRYEVNPKAVAGGLAAVFLVLTLIVWLSNSMFSVEARTVGIVTEFGRATGTVNPGFNFLPPWADVTEFPTSNQNLDLDGQDGDQEGHAIKIKFDGGGTGYVNVNVNWKVKGNNEAIKLWNAWKDFDKVKDQVVTKRVQAHAYEVAGRYLPEDAVKSQNADKIARDIKTGLNEELNDQGIEIVDVNITGIDVDPDTQARINQQAQARSDVEKSKTEQQKAIIDNQTRQQTQASLTPEALVAKCLDMVNKWDVRKNGNLPAGFTCFSGANLPLMVGVK